MLRRPGLLLLAAIAILGGSLALFWNPPVLDGGPPVDGHHAGHREVPGATADTGAGAAEAGSPERERIGQAVESTGRTGFTRALAGFRGRVLRRPGEPAEGVPVAVLRFDDEALLGGGSLLAPRRPPELVAGRASTERDGTFHIPGVWPGSFYVLRAGGGAVRAVTRILPRAPGPGEVIDLGDLVLGAGGAITGRVLGESGSPLAGATVRALPIPEHLLKVWPLERIDLQTPVLFADGARNHVLEIPGWVGDRAAELGLASTRADARGAFRLSGVTGEQVAVFVTAPGRLPSVHPAIQVQPGTDTDLGAVLLDSGRTATGRVVDADGRGVVGAEVLVGQGTALVGWVFPSRTVTGQDGRFVATGFAKAPVLAAARRSPEAPWVFARARPIDEELVLRIPGDRTLTLAVRSRSGKPIDDPRIELHVAIPDVPAVDLSMLGLARPLPLDGRMARLADGRFRLAGLQEGRYLLLACAEGHAVRAVPFTLANDAELEVDLEVQAPFVVVVTDGEGRPVPDARIAVAARGEFPRIPRVPVPCGQTDREGRLKVSRVTSDRVEVRVSHPAHGTVAKEVKLPADFVAVVLQATGAIAGTLSEGGQPPPEGRWNLAVRSTAEQEPLLDLPRLAVPDPKGRYRVTGLAPGEYEVSVIDAADAAPLGLAFDREAFAGRLRGKDRCKVALVRPGGTAQVDLDTDPGRARSLGPAAGVTGTVHVNGRPAEGFEVRGWHERWLSGPVGADGRFDLGQVPVGEPGLYVIDPRVKRSGRFEVLWWKKVKVERDQPIELSIELQLGSIAGSVRHADGHGVPGCQVKLTGNTTGTGGEATHTKLYGVTDRQGRFAFENLPAGVYTALVWDRRNGRGEVSGIEVTGGAQRSGVVIELIRVVQVSGRVEMGAIGQPQWCWIRFYGKDAQGQYVSEEKGGKVWADGGFTVDGVPPGRYEVSIGAMYRRHGEELAWNTKMYVHDALLEVGGQPLRDVVLHPVPRPAKPAAATAKPGSHPDPSDPAEPKGGKDEDKPGAKKQ